MVDEQKELLHEKSVLTLKLNNQQASYDALVLEITNHTENFDADVALKR